MLAVCNYHYIRPNFNLKYPSIFGVTIDQFQSQLRTLKNLGEIIHPKDFLQNYKEVLGSKDNYYLITFDDGLKEQVDFAIPVLKKLNLSALFFINSNNIENKKVSSVHKIHLLRSIIPSNTLVNLIQVFLELRINAEEKLIARKTYCYDTKEDAELKYLINFLIPFSIKERIIGDIFKEKFNEDEIVERIYMHKNDVINLANEGMIGSHGHTHVPFSNLNSTDLLFELNYSKEYFESLTNSKIDYISYPFGTEEVVNNLVKEMTKLCGYKFGFTTKRAFNNSSSHYLALNRFDCNDLPGGKNYKK